MVLNIENIIVEIKEVIIFEFNDFVKVIEEEFGVIVVVFVVVVVVSGEVVVVKDLFDVELIVVGDKKVGVIKVVCEIIGEGFKEVKVIVDNVLLVIKEGVLEVEVNEIKEKFEVVGVLVIFK